MCVISFCSITINNQWGIKFVFVVNDGNPILTDVHLIRIFHEQVLCQQISSSEVIHSLEPIFSQFPDFLISQVSAFLRFLHFSGFCTSQVQFLLCCVNVIDNWQCTSSRPCCYTICPLVIAGLKLIMLLHMDQEISKKEEHVTMSSNVQRLSRVFHTCKQSLRCEPHIGHLKMFFYRFHKASAGWFSLTLCLLMEWSILAASGSFSCFIRFLISSTHQCLTERELWSVLCFTSKWFFGFTGVAVCTWYAVMSPVFLMLGEGC
jgi:hypothetical protein